MRAHLAGFRPDEVGGVTRSRIMLGVEAKRLEQVPLLEAAVHARLAQVSGYSVAKDRRERRQKPRAADELALEREGDEIVTRLREQMMFHILPDVEKALWVRARGWPGTPPEGPRPFAGMVPEAAAGLDALRLSGRLLAFKSVWERPEFEGAAFWRRVKATAGG